ncbi:MAG: hypothetical protein RRZ24_07935 [Clostridia bacterium]
MKSNVYGRLAFAPVPNIGLPVMRTRAIVWTAVTISKQPVRDGALCALA